MKQLLTIGHQHFVLRDAVNANVLLKALADAIPAEDHYQEGDYYYHIKGRERLRGEISIKLVDEKFIVDLSKRRAIPETTGGPY